jgi:transcriptional antiterminator RfaH
MLDRVLKRSGTWSWPPHPPIWIVVNTHARKERSAIENLERQQYTTYCPMIRTRIRHARKTMDVLRPLFPGYLFVDLKHERWRPILSTYGVRSVIRNGDEPARLDDRLIESLRLREIDGAIVRLPSPYRIGQEVQMAGGPLDGLVAKIIALDETDRVVVLLDFLSRSVKARVTVDQLRAS